MRFDCDACCREQVWAVGRRACWVGAEEADRVAVAGVEQYVNDAVAAAFVVFVFGFCMREDVIDFDVGGIESMGVVWDLIVTRVADNEFGPTAGEHIGLALRGLTGLQTLNLGGT